MTSNSPAPSIPQVSHGSELRHRPARLASTTLSVALALTLALTGAPIALADESTALPQPQTFLEEGAVAGEELDSGIETIEPAIETDSGGEDTPGAAEAPEARALPEGDTAEQAPNETIPLDAPAYSSGVWTVESGADLHYAVDNATTGDVFLIMNDLYMGEDLGLVGGVTDPDNIASELFIDKSNMDLTFRSGTGGDVTIYRIDHRRHMYVGSPTRSAYAENISLTFENVVLDGQQSFDVYAARTKQMSDSARGGIALYYTNGITLTGADVRNCFSEVMNVNVGPDGSLLGRDQITNGGGLNGWYVNDFLFQDCSFTGNVSGTVGGGLHLQHASGTMLRCTISDNASVRPSDQAQGGGIYIGSGEATPLIVIQDSTISGNSAAGYSLNSFSGKDWPTTATNPDHGGGIIVNDGTSLTLSNTVVENNEADQGGGVYFGGYYTLRLEDGTSVSNNRALNTHQYVEGNTRNYNFALGGGLMVFYGATLETDGPITVSDNTAESATYLAYGGGMYLTSAQATLSDGFVLDGNSANAPINKVSIGGGVCAMSQTALTAQDGVTISNNQAKRGGGAYLSVTNPATFSGTTFSGNTAVLAGADPVSLYGCGGAIYTSSYEYLYCNGVTFSGNKAEYGGFYLDPADDDYDAIVATHDANVTGTVSLSSPFSIANSNYAYNNYDIDYRGTVPLPSRDLTVARLYGADRYETSQAVSTYGLDDSCNTVILASGDDYNFPDALTASALSGIEDNAPIVLTTPWALSETARAAIEDELKPSKVIIMGDENAGSAAAAAQVEALPRVPNVERIGGTDRMDTADLVYQSRDRSEFSDTAIIALSTDFPDSLSASSWAANTKSPIFLAHFGATDLSTKTKQALADGGFTRVIVLGSNLSVSDSVADQASDLTGAEVLRIGGIDRYETSMLFAQWAIDTAEHGAGALAIDNVAITRGDKHSDALTGGALQGRHASVILLTPPTSAFMPAHDFIVANESVINEIRFFGDENAVALDVIRQFIRCVPCDTIIWKPNESCAVDMS